MSNQFRTVYLQIETDDSEVITSAKITIEQSLTLPQIVRTSLTQKRFGFDTQNCLVMEIQPNNSMQYVNGLAGEVLNELFRSGHSLRPGPLISATRGTAIPVVKQPFNFKSSTQVRPNLRRFMWVVELQIN